MVTPVTQPWAQAQAQKLVSASSSQPIILELTKIAANRHWLASSHVYTNVVTALGDSSNVAVQGMPLAEYIACSVPLHVADGWSFLARAFDAVKAGDTDNAVHMGYYAELRAAMSLLASEGVGVFNRRHVAIGVNYTTTDWIGRGTHNATWELMEAWGNDQNRSPTILGAIKVEQKTITEWFDEAQILPSVAHIIASEWLREWSIDINIFRHDRDLRNRVSYRPRGIAGALGTATDIKAQVIDPILRVWEPLEPSVDVGGAAVDLDLWAFALSRARDRAHLSQLQWNQFVDQRLSTAPPNLRYYLKQPLNNAFSIFRWAGDTSHPA